MLLTVGSGQEKKKTKQERTDAKWKTEIRWSTEVAEDFVRIREQAGSEEGWEGWERQDSVARECVY